MYYDTVKKETIKFIDGDLYVFDDEGYTTNLIKLTDAGRNACVSMMEEQPQRFNKMIDL